MTKKWTKRISERYGKSLKNNNHSQGGNMIHCSTIEERVHMVSLMVAQPAHGVVSQLSRTYRVSRQSLYRWRDTGVRALEEALGHQMMTKKQPGSLQTLVL